jgi:membrane protein implicated in regulation of membrane protease activity
MEPFHIWLIISVLLVIIEIVTAGFGIVCFAVGTLLGALIAYLGCDFDWQMIAFGAGSLLAFVFIRPLALKYLTKKQQYVPMNAQAVVGMTGVVTQEINPAKHTGRVAVHGDDWKAVVADDTVIPVGANVTIVKQDSLILTVESR